MKTPSGHLLLKKLKNGTITQEELALLEDWYNRYAEQAKPHHDLEGYVNNIKKMDAAFPFITSAKRTGLWIKFAAAAAITLILGGLYLLSANRINDHQITYANDIPPGKTGATLTLSNGRKIILSEATPGDLAQESGVSITKSQEGLLVYEHTGNAGAANSINTLSTGKGETFKLRLPDGSLVYLNAASSLSYATMPAVRGKRVVRLQGEGYFEVRKDASHPFIVNTDKQQLEVLGTHFNINAYGDAPDVRTTLLEGIVKVSSLNDKQKSATLRPNQQSVLSKSDVFSVRSVDPINTIDWVKNDFAFNGVDFKTAMNKIARWYDMEILYDADLPEDIEPGGWISRNNNLSVVLKRIEAGGQVHFKIEGRRLRVTR